MNNKLIEIFNFMVESSNLESVQWEKSPKRSRNESNWGARKRGTLRKCFYEMKGFQIELLPIVIYGQILNFARESLNSESVDYIFHALLLSLP